MPGTPARARHSRECPPASPSPSSLRRPIEPTRSPSPKTRKAPKPSPSRPGPQRSIPFAFASRTRSAAAQAAWQTSCSTEKSSSSVVLRETRFLTMPECPRSRSGSRKERFTSAGARLAKRKCSRSIGSRRTSRFWQSEETSALCRRRSGTSPRTRLSLISQTRTGSSRHHLTARPSSRRPAKPRPMTSEPSRSFIARSTHRSGAHKRNSLICSYRRMASGWLRPRVCRRPSGLCRRAFPRPNGKATRSASPTKGRCCTARKRWTNIMVTTSSISPMTAVGWSSTTVSCSIPDPGESSPSTSAS